MSRDDATYFEQRAETQIELARKSTDKRAVQAHYDLANAYLDKVYSKDASEMASGDAEKVD